MKVHGKIDGLENEVGRKIPGKKGITLMPLVELGKREAKKGSNNDTIGRI